MLQRLLILFSFLALASSAFSQDVVYTVDGEVIQASIVEIKDTEITYHSYNNPDGPLYVIAKSSVRKIVFESGIEETFNNSGQQTDLYGNDANNINKVTQPDKIYLTDGKVIECEVVEKKRFGINYIPVRSQNNYVEYIANTKIDRIEYANGDVEYISGTPKNSKHKDPKDFSYLSPHYVSLNFGPSIPIGAFGSSQGNGGYANTGFDVTADVTYYLFRGLGFSGTLGYSYNPFSSVGASYMQSSIMGSDTAMANANINVGQWHNVYLLGGIGYYNDFGRLILDYKAMGGVLFSMHPTAEANYMVNGDSYRDVYSKGTSVSFLFGGYSGFRYFITRKWAIKGGFTMFFGKATFDAQNGMIKKQYVNGVLQSESVSSIHSPVPFELPINWIMIHAGVSFSIGK